MAQFVNLLILGVLAGAIYALIATGLVVIYRASGVLNFAQGYLLLVGAGAVWSFAAWLHLPGWLSIILGLACAWFLGMMIERFTVRPLLGQPVLSTIVMTLGLSIILLGISGWIWGTLGRGYTFKLFPTGMWYLGDINVPQLATCSLVVTVAVLIGLQLYLGRSKSGLAMQGVADDTQCARSLGVKATSILSLTWALAATVAALSGYLFGNIGGIEVMTMPMIGFKAIAAMLIGGMESLTGAILGGLLIGICEYMTSGYLDPWLASVGWGGAMKEVSPFIILVIALLVRPYGFFGWKRIERV